MRNTASQVETRELADGDLDNISGGVGVALGIDGLGLGDLVAPVTDALPVGQVTGLVGGATNTLSGITGLAGL
ncbi:type A2 lantipeptide [Streptomyces sp. NBC_00669]|uniref:type A2 lantipeptide n=1 Tax=unclassified Streptomyces TaxID=2593676 RepID=UPI002E1C8A16|nr:MULTISPECIES: type A2 lantipeptide [unclassified Streptomyces]